MKNKLYLIAFFVLCGSIAFAGDGDCGLQPLKPIPPIGCKDTTPICQCDSDNRCQWVFECVPDEVAALRLIAPLDLPRKSDVKKPTKMPMQVPPSRIR